MSDKELANMIWNALGYEELFNQDKVVYQSAIKYLDRGNRESALGELMTLTDRAKEFVPVQVWNALFNIDK